MNTWLLYDLHAFTTTVFPKSAPFKQTMLDSGAIYLHGLVCNCIWMKDSHTALYYNMYNNYILHARSSDHAGAGFVGGLFVRRWALCSKHLVYISPGTQMCIKFLHALTTNIWSKATCTTHCQLSGRLQPQPPQQPLAPPLHCCLQFPRASSVRVTQREVQKLKSKTTQMYASSVTDSPAKFAI